MTNPAEVWYTPARAAAWLGLHVSTVYELLASRRLGSCRVGPRRGRHRITEAHVAAYLAAGEAPPAPPAGPAAAAAPRARASGVEGDRAAVAALVQRLQGQGGGRA